MKKHVFASVALACVCCGSIAGLPAFAQTTDGQSAQAGACAQVTIKDAAEYNAYANATSQSTPAAKAAAIEAFLQQYPNSQVKNTMLENLMGAYQQAGDAAKTLDTAKRLLQSDPNNLRAMLVVVYLEHQQANGNQQLLDDAAAEATKALSAPKDQCMAQADYDKVKDTATPIFEGAIGADDLAKKDAKGAVDAYTKELQSYKDPAQTTVVPGLLDTYYLGNAYLQEDPKDLVNAIWFLTRAAQFSKPPYQAQIESAAEYWYKKYHGGMDGFDQIKALAAVPANVFPPADYKPVAAPPPPSPQDLAHQAVASTTDLKTLALSDKEFILANGTPDDAQKVWAVMNGVTAEVPGVIVSATADSVQLAVSQDAQQSMKADFTVNMKTPLKEIPTQGTKVTFIATFDSYTQNPPMIILKDGEQKVEKKAAPVHHTTTHRSQ